MMLQEIITLKPVNASITNNPGFKLIHQNINGLLNKIDILEFSIINDESPDVLCLTEHHMKESQIDSMLINGYNCVASYCRPSKKSGGGVCILIKDNLCLMNLTYLNSALNLSVKCLL